VQAQPFQPAQSPQAVLPGQPAASNAPAGKIQFAEPVFDFGRIKHGEIVSHKFIFTNIGAETLTIKHVHAPCGCTATADWTREVEPGGTGVIPVQFNSLNRGPQVLQTISVLTSQAPQPVVLQMKGEVWKPLDISPNFAVINVLPDAGGGSTTVRIINNTQEPLNFSDLQINNRAFQAAFEPSPTNPAKEHLLRIWTVPPLPKGNVQGQVTFKTGSTNVPNVTLTAWANVQPAFVVMPGQITLPAGPLPKSVTPSLLVQNNSTNDLSITEPAINVPDVTIDIRETQPGRQFSIALAFPAGFEIKPGQKVVFTAKSTSPAMPTIEVPVAQMPRAAGAPRPTAAPQFLRPPSAPLANH
jgi:hypothetical protein